MKNILKMSNSEVNKYFKKSSSYFNLELPTYFNFDKLLNKIIDDIGEKPYSSFYKNNAPKKEENVNYKIVHNKDSKYAWRQFQLIHPFLYLELVELNSNEEN